MSKVAFNQRPQGIQRIQIDQQMENADVDEHGCEQSPCLSGGDKLIDLSAECDKYAQIFGAAYGIEYEKAIDHHSDEN